MLGGLALGREGPSIQLGAMAGKGVSRKLDRGKTEEHFLITCGASAGLAAAFHAPLAGVMFSLEEIHKNFSVSVLTSVMTASLTADILSTLFLGTDSVFRFEIVDSIPIRYYWMIVLPVSYTHLMCIRDSPDRAEATSAFLQKRPHKPYRNRS